MPSITSPSTSAAAADSWSDRLLAALAESADGVLLVDRGGGCSVATPRARALLETDAALDGVADWNGWPATAREAVRPAVAGAAASGRPTATRTCPAFHGRPLAVRATPAGDAFLVTVSEAPDDPLDREAATTLDRLPDVVLRYDREGVIRYVNAAIVAATGQPLSHFIGQRADATGMAPAISSRFAAARATVFASGQPVTFEIRRATPLGERCIEYRMVPERDAGGTIVTALAIGRDVTDTRERTRELRESEARYRSLVEATSQIVWHTGPRGEIRAHDNGDFIAFTRAPDSTERRDELDWLASVHADDRARVEAEWLGAVAAQRPYESHYRLRRGTDGQWRHTIARGVPVRDAKGDVVEWVGTVTDVTEQVALETALRESERRMATLLSNLPGMAYRMRDDEHWSAEFASEGALALTGHAPEAFESPDGVSFAQIIHPEDLDRVRAVTNGAVAAGHPFTITYRIVRADGAVRWVWEQGREVPRDAAAGSRMLEGLIVDVTDREEARVALEAERARLEEAQRIAHLGSWELDFRGGGHVVSDEALRVLGTGPEARRDPLGTFVSLVTPEDRAAVDARIAQVRAGERAWTAGRYVIERPDGERRVVQMRSAWTHDEHGALVSGRGTLQDVTDVVEGEARLARQQALLEESQRLAHVGSWEWDRRTDRLTWSDEMYRLVGMAPDAGAEPRRFADIVHLDDMEAVLARFREALATAQTIELEHRLLRADGSAIAVHARTRMITDEAGVVVRVVGSVQDVSEHRAAQAALRLSQEQQVALLQSIPDAAWLKDVDGRYLALNEAAWRARGMEPAAVIGRTAPDLFAPELAADRLAHDRAVLEGGRPMLVEHQDIGPDGARRWYETIKAPYYDAAGAVAGIVGIARDITARRQLEEQVRQSQKMDALGLLAGSVAHDFNNLLSAIIGGTELARLEVPDGTQLAQDLDDVRHAAQRGAQLTRQLLAFSRKQVSQSRPLDLRDTVRDSAKLLRRLLPEDVALDVTVGDGADAPSAGDAPLVVRADAGQLEQVLMNLVVNARDAVVAKREAHRQAAGGPLSASASDVADQAPPVDVVTIAVARVVLAPGDPRLARRGADPLPPGAYAMLTVRDSGVGMDASTRARAFEPFFTTKPPGRGTGLGLATVLGIVEQSGGTVQLHAAPGAGAAFTIVLPLIEGPADVVAVGTRTALPGGTETVLLVEDEAAVRETATRILERHGYQVLAARHGGDALLAWADHAATVDVVVTDLRMPAVDGKTLIACLRAEQPALPIVVMSGYASGKDPEERVLLEREVFLTKPFSAESLLQQVRAALDGAERRG
ncbi:MAG: PAS domain-containing protein [Gemmatirosa sp.]